jgi:hypothetical protein
MTDSIETSEADAVPYVAPVKPQLELDFDSDEPLPVCPLRNNGDDICESCQ